VLVAKKKLQALLQLKANDLDRYDTPSLAATQILLLTAAGSAFMAKSSC
jgi:hypothetical protein